MPNDIEASIQLSQVGARLTGTIEQSVHGEFPVHGELLHYAHAPEDGANSDWIVDYGRDQCDRDADGCCISVELDATQGSGSWTGKVDFGGDCNGVRCYATYNGYLTRSSSPTATPTTTIRSTTTSTATVPTTTTTSSTTTSSTTSSTTTTTFPNCTLVAGNLVQNCDFEMPVTGSFMTFGPGDTSLTGWTVATLPSGGIDLVTSTFSGGYPVQGGEQSLDLNAADAGGISQDIITTAGQSYRLIFFLSGFPAGSAPCPASDPKTLTVTAGSASATYSFTPDTQASPPGNQPFVQETLSFTAAAGSSTTLTFTSTSGGCAGPVIDDVIVVPVP